MTSGLSSRRRRARAALALAAVLPLSSCIGIVSPLGPTAEAQWDVLLNSTTIMTLAVLLPVIGMVLLFAWRYRANGGTGTYRPAWAYSGAVELVVWAVPILIIIFLGGITWIGSHRLEPSNPVASGREPLQVQVVALDWKWLFIYPTLNVASVNELVLPVDQPVSFRLTSASVMNSFQVPNMGTQIYVMNGMETKLNLMPTRLGSFHGLSTHYSGAGFSFMKFETQVLDTAGFSQWIGRAQSGGPLLDTAAYTKLLEPSYKDPASAFGSVQSGLFNSIVLRTAPDAPGLPPSGEPPRTEASAHP